MVSVIIDNITFTHVINADFDYNTTVSHPEWINQNPVLNTNIWTKKCVKIIYTVRSNDNQKYLVDKMLKQCRVIYLRDEYYGLLHSGWLKNINAIYDGKNNSVLPWKLDLEYISMYESSLNYYGFQKINETQKFADGFERHEIT